MPYCAPGLGGTAALAATLAEPAAMGDYVAAPNSYRVTSAPVDPAGVQGALVLAGTYMGPPPEDAAFRDFANARWGEAQARGHAYMLIALAAATALAAEDFPGHLHALAGQLERGDYAGAERTLAAAERDARARPCAAAPVYMCVRLGGVHSSTRYWLPPAEQTTVTLIAPPPGAPGPPGAAGPPGAPGPPALANTSSLAGRGPGRPATG